MPGNSPFTTASGRTQTVYFAYGSNMHLTQMAARCPESRYLGIGTLADHKWQINTRGFANIVQSKNDYVQGLCYLLSHKDEVELDLNEGVPIAYTKKILQIRVHAANALIVGRRVTEVKEYIDRDQRSQVVSQDTRYQLGSGISLRYHSNDSQMLEALVYVNKTQITNGNPRQEYIARMASGVSDAMKLGISWAYLERCINKPMEGVPKESQYQLPR